MKYAAIVCALSFVSVSVLASNTDFRNPTSPYEVVVPVLVDDPPAEDRVAGQIYYNATDSAFRGISKDGDVDTLAVTGNSAVISGGTERIERVRFNCDASSSIYQQSGTWVSVGNVQGTGPYYCELTIIGSPFSTTPTCSFSAEGTTPAATSLIPNASFVRVYSSSNAFDGHLICMGPQ